MLSMSVCMHAVMAVWLHVCASISIPQLDVEVSRAHLLTVRPLPAPSHHLGEGEGGG